MSAGVVQDGPDEYEPVIVGGHSNSWTNGKANGNRHFDLFLGTSPAKKKTDSIEAWDDLPETILITAALYDLFAGYMMKKKILAGRNSGSHYAWTSICGWLHTALNRAKTKFCSSPEAILFFTCLSCTSGTPSADWLAQLKNSIERDCYQRGDNKDGQSAEPIYREHIESMSEAFVKEGSNEAMERKWAIVCAYLAGGRASESASVNWETLRYDIHFKKCFAEVRQSKVRLFVYNILRLKPLFLHCPNSSLVLVLLLHHNTLHIPYTAHTTHFTHHTLPPLTSLSPLDPSQHPPPHLSQHLPLYPY
jgi:hypothetical protein